jgi:hypothetical protein
VKCELNIGVVRSPAPSILGSRSDHPKLPAFFFHSSWILDCIIRFYGIETSRRPCLMTEERRTPPLA